MIYNSPYYGFETRAELFFELRAEHPNLVGYKEFGGQAVAVLCGPAHHLGVLGSRAARRRRHAGRPRHRLLRCRGRDHRDRQRDPRRRADVDRALPAPRRTGTRRRCAWPSSSSAPSGHWRSSTKVPTSCSSTSTSPCSPETRLRAPGQLDGHADPEPAPLRRRAVRAVLPMVVELGWSPSPRRRRDARVGVSLADFPVVSVLTATNVGGWACRQRGDGRCGDRRRTSARSG